MNNMVKEKQKQRQKNSSFIARAIIENSEKFRIIEKLYQKHKELIREKEVIMTNILKIYNLGFKNFSQTKILLGTIGDRTYYATLKGIVRPISNRQMKNNLSEDFIKSLETRTSMSITGIYKEFFDIGKNKEMLIKSMNYNQRKIFNGFFKYYRYAKQEPKVILKTKMPITVIESIPGFIQPYTYKTFDSLSLIDNTNEYNIKKFDFCFSMNETMVLSIRFDKLYLTNALNEKIFIEQTFCYLKTLLSKEIANRQKEIRRLNAFYTKIKHEFRNHILLEKIEEEK